MSGKKENIMLGIAREFSEMDEELKTKATAQYQEMQVGDLPAKKLEAFEKADAYTIARKLNKFSVTSGDNKIKIADLVQSYDIESVAKLLEVSKELQKMRNEAPSLKSALRECLDAISEMWKKVTGAERISMDDLGKALVGMSRDQHANKQISEQSASIDTGQVR